MNIIIGTYFVGAAMWYFLDIARLRKLVNTQASASNLFKFHSTKLNKYVN